MEAQLICLALALIGGLMMSRLTKKIHLPAVTAYLLAGLVLGPYCIGRLNIPGVGFQDAQSLGILTQTALGFIAFSMGNEFRLSQLKTYGSKAIFIGIVQAVITTLLVDACLICLHLLFPELLSVSAAITLGAIAAATAPAATVMVIGLGGVGSNCVEALVRGGVGHLIVIDHDIVGLSNINRQAIAFHSTLGRKKHEVVRDMVHDINPDCQVEALDMFLRADDVAPLLDRYLGKVDMLIDAIDSVSAKLAIAEYADRTGMPLISSMGGANKLHPECLRFADVSETRNDPLARVMRKECRKRGIRRLRVLYSCEEPVKRPAVEGAERRERTNLGTASFMPPIFGQMLAGKVLCEIAQVPEA